MHSFFKLLAWTHLI